jgi:hypothetical protein
VLKNSCENDVIVVSVGAQELKMMTKGITAQNERMKKRLY